MSDAVAGQAGESLCGNVDSRKVKVDLCVLSDGMICAAAQILEASGFCEIGPTMSEVLAEEILLAALSVEYNR